MDDVAARVEAYIFDNLVLGDRERVPARDVSLIESGVIDSTGVLELIEYLEDDFGIRVEDAETVPENLDSIDRIAAFVARKQV